MDFVDIHQDSSCSGPVSSFWRQIFRSLFVAVSGLAVGQAGQMTYACGRTRHQDSNGVPIIAQGHRVEELCLLASEHQTHSQTVEKCRCTIKVQFFSHVCFLCAHVLRSCDVASARSLALATMLKMLS